MDVISRWRDAITDPPEHIKNVIIKQKEKNDAVGYWSLTYCQWYDLFGESFEVEPGDQWLDITDEPAIPRAFVQAAVDEIVKLEDAAATRTTAFWHGTEDGLLASLIVIKDHTGITPTDHFRDATKKEE